MFIALAMQTRAPIVRMKGEKVFFFVSRACDSFVWMDYRKERRRIVLWRIAVALVPSNGDYYTRTQLNCHLSVGLVTLELQTINFCSVIKSWNLSIVQNNSFAIRKVHFTGKICLKIRKREICWRFSVAVFSRLFLITPQKVHKNSVNNWNLLHWMIFIEWKMIQKWLNEIRNFSELTNKQRTNSVAWTELPHVIMTKFANSFVVSKRVKTISSESLASSYIKRHKLHLLKDKLKSCGVFPVIFREQSHLIGFMNRLVIYDNCRTNCVSMGVLSPATTSTSSCSNEEDLPHSQSLASSATSSTDHFEQHVLEPIVHTVNGIEVTKRPCLTWACKACKKKTVTVDRRKAATLRGIK